MTATPPDDGLSHDDTNELTAVLTELRDEVRGLRADVVNERKGRRLTITVGAVVVTLALILGGGYLADLRATANREEVQSCEIRTESRAEIRAAIQSAVVEVAEFAELEPTRTAEIGRAHV